MSAEPTEPESGPSSHGVVAIAGGVRLEGELGLADASRIYQALTSATPDDRGLHIDLDQVRSISSVALAAVIAGLREHTQRGVAIRSTGNIETSTALEHALQRAPAMLQPPPLSALQAVGERTLAVASSTRELASMTTAVLSRFALLTVRRIRLPRRALGDKIVIMGTDATAIVALLSLLLGITLTFESIKQLGPLGARILVPDVVGLSMVREFAPLLTAVVVIGRNGAAMASELASMRAGQEVDALRTMGIEPIQFLVVPRALGLLITSPILTLLTIVVGLLGAAGVALAMADIDLALFYRRLVAAVALSDLSFGLAKSVVFAMTTGLAAAAIGMAPSASAADVGRATTRSVVLGIFLLVVADAIFAFTSGVSYGPAA